MPELDPDRWEEVVNSIRGSCLWCKSAIYVCHLCELIVLSEGVEPASFGVQQESSYQKPSASSSRKPTVFIDHRFLVEHTNPARGLRPKATAFACVLAHEMAHHAIYHRRSFPTVTADLVAVPLETRRDLLRSLGAERYAKLTGIPLSVVDEHWASSDQCSPSRDVVAEQPKNPRGSHSRISVTAATARRTEKQIASEWGAAVIGCMVAIRLSGGTMKLRHLYNKASAEHPSLRTSVGVTVLFNTACGIEGAEHQSEERAIAELNGAHRNPDIQSCNRQLKAAGSEWAAVSPKLGAV